MSTKVLIVEDSEFIRDLVRETLAFEDFEVRVEDDGPTGLAAAKELDPDVVLLDVRLGGDLDGLEVCRRLKADEPDLPVIFLSGLADASDVERGYEAGGTAYLTKPFSPLELIERIRSVCAG